MLCTVISDLYSRDEKRALADALDELLAAGSPDWSRKGVYAYWDSDTHELLYVGLAIDLPDRFRQHNDLQATGGGTKKAEIDAYLAVKPRLGFTVVIQAAAVELLGIINRLDPLLGAQPDEVIAVGEGQLIQMHKLVTGSRPKWNKKGGSVQGQRMATASKSLLDVLTARDDRLFVARRTLRELADDAQAQRFEAAIHTARMQTVMEAHGIIGHLPPEEVTVGTIEKMLLISRGHIVDDLEASDASIRDALERIVDNSARKRELAEMREQLDVLRGEDLQPHEEAVAALLAGLMAEGAPTEEAVTVKEIFDCGYLDQRIQLTT